MLTMRHQCFLTGVFGAFYPPTQSVHLTA